MYKRQTLNTSVATQGMAIVNALHPPFDKPQARQALYYLFSQKEMLAAIGYPEKYRVDYCATLYICGSPLATDAGAAPYAKPDLARAKQLLQEAGYKGEKIVVLYPTDHISAPAVMVLTQNMKKAGLKVDLQSMDWASLAARRLKKDPPEQGGWSLFLTWEMCIRDSAGRARQAVRHAALHHAQAPGDDGSEYAGHRDGRLRPVPVQAR